MRNPKELALRAILNSLQDSGVEVTEDLTELVEDLVNKQWENRNQDRDPNKDEAELSKLIREFVTRNPRNGVVN